VSESTYSEVQSIEFSQLDTSYHMCLARWAFWVIDFWDVDEEDSETDFRRDVAVIMFTALGPVFKDINRDNNAWVQAFYSSLKGFIVNVWRIVEHLHCCRQCVLAVRTWKQHEKSSARPMGVNRIA
jgi:hypothetical protein